LALLRHPDQLALLRADFALLPSAVEEFLRFSSPVNVATVRFTTKPTSIAGTLIGAGEIVLISLLSANRDANRFSSPDQLDITRKPNAHVAFGHGIHYCLGAPLARLEGQLAFEQLLKRFPQIALAENEEPKYRDSILMHGLVALPTWLSTAHRRYP
jgi:cytochrome P450